MYSSWARTPRARPILQGADVECGLACAAMILSVFGVHIPMPELRDRYPVSMRGTTLKSLMTLFSDFNLISRPVQADLGDLVNLRLPAIIHWDFEHYVVLESASSRGARIIDPKVGRCTLSTEQLSNHFTGIALEITRGGDPVPSIRKFRHLSLRRLLAGWGAELPRSILSLMIVTLAVNVLALASPLILKFALDRVAPVNDIALLHKAILGFLMAALLQFLVEVYQAARFADFRHALSLYLSRTVFWNLIWNTSAYFNTRSPGLIESQFRGLYSITQTLNEGVVSKSVDIVAVAAGLIIVSYQIPALGIVILTTVTLYAMIMWLTFQQSKARLAEMLTADSKVSQHFLETVNAIQSVKLYGLEYKRLSSWDSLTGSSELALGRLTKYKGRLRAVLDLTTAVAWLLAIYYLVLRLLSKDVSVGLFTAAVSWTSFLMLKAQGLVQAALDVGALEAYVDQLDDIVSHAKETHAYSEPAAASAAFNRPDLRFAHVSYRYDKRSPLILDDCSLHLRCGAVTTVRGRSGVGKTTLLKLTLGLITPQQGTITVGNAPLTPQAMPHFRRICAAVFQDDTLFAGSLRDNISLFDPAPDDQFMRECAQMACIDEFIDGLPMQYETLVMRGGAGFSAGQNQRIILARALYRRPQLLVLDEFTSNLDTPTEATIFQHLRRLGITILTAAHRATFDEFSDTVLELEAGRLLVLRDVAKLETA